MFIDRWQQYRTESLEVGSGWVLETVFGPSALFGANGMCFGTDGKLYVCQVAASQVSRFDIDSGHCEVFSPLDGGIIDPDDGVFGADGTFYASDVFIGRVSARNPDGTYRVVIDDMPSVNGITTDLTGKRLFVNCPAIPKGAVGDIRGAAGTLWEVDPAGSGERTLLMDKINTPNGMMMGPDGKLYFPAVSPNELWSYDFEEERGRREFGRLDTPTALKIDSKGRLVTTEATGRVIRCDLSTGKQEVIGDLPRGLDNLAISPDDRVFASHWVDGSVTELTEDGPRLLSPPGLAGPWGLWPRRDGTLFVADMFSVKVLDRNGQVIAHPAMLGRELQSAAVGVCEMGRDLVVLGEMGGVHIYTGRSIGPHVLANGLRGASALFAESADSVLVAESDAGCLTRVRRDGTREILAEELSSPRAAACDDRGNIFLSQGDGAPLLMLEPGGGRRELANLRGAQGLAVNGGDVLVADVEANEIVAIDIDTGATEVVVRDAPIGLPIEGNLFHAFAPVASEPDGGFVVGFNGDGSIRRLRRK